MLLSWTIKAEDDALANEMLLQLVDQTVAGLAQVLGRFEIGQQLHQRSRRLSLELRLLDLAEDLPDCQVSGNQLMDHDQTVNGLRSRAINCRERIRCTAL